MRGKRPFAGTILGLVACVLAWGMPGIAADAEPSTPKKFESAPRSERSLGRAGRPKTTGGAAVSRGLPHPSPVRASAEHPTTTVDINPARITTFAGNGTNATVDNANGLNASFKDMAGAVVVGNYAYVSTAGAIRKVDLTSSQVTTLAGSATQSGCVENNDPTLVRFSLNIGQITSDGTYLYTADPGCT